MNFMTKFTFQSIYLPFGSKIFETYAFYSIFMQLCQAEKFKNLFHLTRHQACCVINWLKFNCCPKQEHQLESRHENELSRTKGGTLGGSNVHLNSQSPSLNTQLNKFAKTTHSSTAL